MMGGDVRNFRMKELAIRELTIKGAEGGLSGEASSEEHLGKLKTGHFLGTKKHDDCLFPMASINKL